MAFALAIETSSRVGELAIVRDGTILETRSFAHGLQNAARVIPILDALCRDHGCAPPDIQAVYLSIGPGSFTGIRIAVTLAKTLALATGAKLLAVPTTRILVENAPEAQPHVMVILDARRGMVFCARYERQDSRWIEREPARLDRLPDALARSPRPLLLLGEGIAFHKADIPADPRLFVADEPLWQPRAAAVARLGREMESAGQFADPNTLAPLYLRLPEAEEKRRQQTSESK